MTLKPKRGRPPVDSQAVHMRIPSELLSAIDDWRRAREDMPTRTEAIRRLLITALNLKGDSQ